MEQRHIDYIEYYRSRVKKYENNPMYKNSYLTEKALFEAVSGIENLEDFREIMETQKLHVKNAVALVKDKSIAEKDAFTEMKEIIRAHAAERILEVIDSIQSEMELVKTCSQTASEANIEISIDQMVSFFYIDFPLMENVISWENAEVPSEWKNEINSEWPAEARASLKKIWEETTVPQARYWAPEWNLNYDLLWEDRHRRLIPVPDEVLQKMIEQHKKARGI
ncbi:MAG: hypothetical protein NTU98_04320 [Bacteroidetes bacterium]|nr:hypothetical protein [Bacteroidota bacterium]